MFYADITILIIPIHAIRDYFYFPLDHLSQKLSISLAWSPWKEKKNHQIWHEPQVLIDNFSGFGAFSQKQALKAVDPLFLPQSAS